MGSGPDRIRNFRHMFLPRTGLVATLVNRPEGGVVGGDGVHVVSVDVGYGDGDKDLHTPVHSVVAVGRPVGRVGADRGRRWLYSRSMGATSLYSSFCPR